MDSSVFSLAPEELEELRRKAQVRNLPRQALVVSEGDRTDSLYIILSGKVKVFLAEEGRQVTLRQLGPGDYFGEMVLDQGPRSASVMTLEPTSLAMVSRESFEAFIGAHPEFTLRLIKKLIHFTRGLTNSVRSLALLDVYGRVARLLLELAVERDGKRVIPEKLTQREIASRVGASREMIGLILRDLTVGGYISVAGREITINREPPKHW
ncbi:MAG TPA: cyclic nucleotide-binding domain-containing protein [Burkholderiales bacterium]|jgi:CRP/FNR family cyclic AMP-dependent transcriptional regulator|nr:cyclic nucleotide-binding domain-containing protein [Burkholderiales bacterium]